MNTEELGGFTPDTGRRDDGDHQRRVRPLRSVPKRAGYVYAVGSIASVVLGTVWILFVIPVYAMELVYGASAGRESVGSAGSGIGSWGFYLWAIGSLLTLVLTPLAVRVRSAAAAKIGPAMMVVGDLLVAMWAMANTELTRLSDFGRGVYDWWTSPTVTAAVLAVFVGCVLGLYLLLTDEAW